MTETAFHRHWECKANDDMGREHVKASAWVKQLAKGGELACPAYWRRGITPASWVAAEAPPAAPEAMETGVFKCGESAVARADGSGGPDSSDKRLRRLAWACALLTDVGSCEQIPALTWSRAGALGGTCQAQMTVPRAELCAVCELLERLAEWLEGDGSGVTKVVRLYSDASTVVDRWPDPDRRLRQGENGELWDRACRARARVKSGGCELHVLKVRAHQDLRAQAAVKTAWFSASVYGNAVADVLADKAADEARVGVARRRHRANRPDDLGWFPAASTELRWSVLRGSLERSREGKAAEPGAEMAWRRRRCQGMRWRRSQGHASDAPSATADAAWGR